MPVRRSFAWFHMDRWLSTLCLIQGIYFVITGVWPIVHIKSFMAVTGPKNDLWLVRTVGALVTVIGAAVAVGRWRGTPANELLVIAIGSALVLMLVDVIYVTRRVIPPVYLADAAAEAVLLVAWGVWLLQRSP
jgi:hypothetical protein